MKKTITCAAIQMEIVPHAIEQNINKAEELIADLCLNGGVDLVVLPEDFITGPIPYDLDLAFSESSGTIQEICRIAKKYAIYLVAGSCVTREADNYYNTSMLIDPKGDILLTYKKNNLWHPERNYLTPGVEAPVVKTPIGTIGIAICWDLAFPQIFQDMAQKGAEVICVPSYWTLEDSGMLKRRRPDSGEPERTMIDTLCPARAIENECLIVYANGAGKANIKLKTKTISLNQAGHSQICAPIYGTVAKLDGNREGYVAYTYDRTIAKDAEQVYKLRRDMLQV